jgi:hypothetical protein
MARRTSRSSLMNEAMRETEDTVPHVADTEPAPGAEPQKPRRGRPPGRPAAWEAQVREGLNQYLVMASLAVGARCSDCGSYMAQGSAQVVEAWINVAKRNPTVKSVLVRMTTGGVFAEAFMSTALLILPMLSHHGRLPEQVGRMFVLPTTETAGADGLAEAA